MCGEVAEGVWLSGFSVVFEGLLEFLQEEQDGLWAEMMVFVDMADE